tara:strand:+ start:232 stop:468 length:237 start_codon:yes stop_codon:yes gene_type:complete
MSTGNARVVGSTVYILPGKGMKPLMECPRPQIQNFSVNRRMIMIERYGRTCHSVGSAVRRFNENGNYAHFAENRKKEV